MAFAAGVLEAAGAPAEHARHVAGSLVRSDLLGIDSHGVLRLLQYVEEIEAGLIDPAARPAVARRGAFVVVDGRSGFGQLAAAAAAGELARRALEGGLAAATVSGVRHVGRLGEYVETPARAGLVALAFANAGPPGGRVAPFGGARAFLPTNPIAYALPAAEGPVVADFSTSVVAEGRVRLARLRGQRVPEGWLVDAQGRATDDPAALYEGGALLPAGAHKGTALALLCELVAGALTGAGTASTGDDPGNGLFLLALDPAALGRAESLPAAVSSVVDALRRVPAAPGRDRVRAPGDLERETAARRSADGIPIAETTWRALAEIAAKLGVPAPAPQAKASCASSESGTAGLAPT